MKGAIPLQTLSIFDQMALYDDEWYVSRLRAGGRLREQATSAFMREHIGLVRKLRYKFRLDEQTAIDLFSDAVVGLILQLEAGKYRGESKLFTYFYRVFYNRCVDYLRKHTTNTFEFDPEMQIPDSSKSEIARWFERMEVEDVKGKLRKLGEPCMQILLEWGFWGYSMKEIADRVGYDHADQVKKRKYKCLQQLRKLLTA